MFKKNVSRMGMIATLLFIGCAPALAIEDLITLQCGDYQLQIGPTYKYTMREIRYEGSILTARRGFYGTVITTAPGMYIGAGHLEGGEEEVLSIDLYADGEKTALEIGTRTANEFVLRKVSMLDKLKFLTEITMTSEGIIERKRFVATDIQPINFIYIYLLCGNMTMTDWLAETTDGESLSGQFDGDFEGSTRWHLQRDVKWAVEYNEADERGILYYYPEPIEGEVRRSAFWEVPTAYNKYYLMMKTPDSYAAGYRSPTYTLVIKGFGGTPSEWEAVVSNTVTSASTMEIPALVSGGLAVFIR